MRKTRVCTAATIFCLSAAFVGCSKEKSSSNTSIPFLDISASASSVVANGVNSVTLSVIDTGGGPVSVTTTRGAFSTGGQSASVAGASGSLTLVTCDAAASGCAGAAVVTATSATGTDSVSITFGTLATACAASCAADPGCASLACNLPAGGSGTCSATTPSACIAGAACTPAGPTETTCDDGNDDDCDGDVDCADADCDDQACQAGSPAFLCKAAACTDTTSGLALELSARTRLPAVAGITTPVTLTVTGDSAPVAGMGVTISTTPASVGTLSAPAGTTGPDGTVTFTFTATGNTGVATLTASITSVPQVTRSATITVPRLGSFQLPENPGPVQHAVQGARGSGWNEFGWVQVQVLDDVGQPYPDGLPVRFEHRTLGGSTLGPPLTGTVGSCAAPACVGFDGQTSSGTDPPDTDGLAKAYLYSGTVAGTLAVTATTTAGGVTRTVALPTVAVVGAKASGSNFAITCSPRNVPALAETDCAISLVDAPFTCEALLKDRFNNVLGTATQVIFMSEAAAVGQVTTTPAFDPTGPADGLGVALQAFGTLGAGLPFDVTPLLAGEPSVDLGAPDVCGVRFHNPRDGVVTLIAIADGEEGFFDANGNGAYDAAPVAEPFIDQGEPFVDQDDDGAWDPGEWFLDVNGNGTCDPPNGTWDASAKIWTQTVVVYTGPAATLPGPAGTFLGTRWADGTFAGACSASAAPAPFQVYAEVTTPPPSAASSQTYFVVASDMNLNLLHTGATYGVAVREPGKVVATYNGLPSYADDLGFFYRYWPCDQTGACASQCRATGANAPCEMTPSLSGFSCGVESSVTIRGGSEADGLNSIEWTVDVPWDVYGSSKVSHRVRTLQGNNSPGPPP